MREPLTYKQDFTVGNIIELEESRISGHDTTIIDPSLRSEQFQATRRWNMLLSKFYKQMPQKNHRRQFWNYTDSFTGKEAVDFLLDLFPKVVPNKPCDISNAEKFMQLLMQKNLVEDVRNPNLKTFNSKSCIYRFLTENIVKEIEATKPTKRSNSLSTIKPIIQPGRSSQKLSYSKSARRSSSHSNLNSLVQSSNMIESNSSHINCKPETHRAVYDKHDSFLNKPTPSTIYESIQGTPRMNQPPCDSFGEDNDYERAWKQFLTNVVIGENIIEVLSQNIKGKNIKWNCTRVGNSGVVIVESGDLQMEIKKGLKTLMTWNPDSENAQNQTGNMVFNLVNEKIASISPIIGSFEGKKLALLWHHFAQRIVDERHDNHIVRKNSTPFFGSTCSTISTSSYASSISQPEIKYIDEFETPNVPRNSRAQFHQHLASAAASEFKTSATPSVIGEITSIPDFRAALQAVLLNFPPAVRRTLHLICRFIKRIGANSYLKLHETKTTFDYLIEQLGRHIFDFTAGYISARDGIALIRIMIEKQTILFCPSIHIIKNAEAFYNARLHGAPTPKLTTYCQQIDVNEYTLNSQTNNELLSLLDSIISNENLSESQKRKKLESFRKTYPTLYVIRFPEPAADKERPKRRATPTRLITNGIRMLARRGSTKRI